MEKICRFGHQCTSGCQKDFDCPCQSEHCCDVSEDVCGDTEECEYCAKKAGDLADKVNDDLNER